MTVAEVIVSTHDDRLLSLVDQTIHLGNSERQRPHLDGTKSTRTRAAAKMDDHEHHLARQR